MDRIAAVGRITGMRIDPGTCRDPDLLASEVRRLQAVIAANAPTLTDAEREAIRLGELAVPGLRITDKGEWIDVWGTLRGLLERTR